MIKRSVDERDGIIFVTGSGVWTIADVDEHFAELRRLIDARRVADQPIRLLSDVTRAERQSPEVEAHIQRFMENTYRPGDRIAILVATEEDRKHVRAKLGAADVAAFCSSIAAEMWLMLEGQASAA